MDSMRSLNRSLPSTDRPAPPEQLLQAFKQAALSVTNLYKAAASDQESIRQAGYQDAIDDLLKFLDRENLGLQDGEGWRIRQWATARYDGSHIQPSDDEEDEVASVEQQQQQQQQQQLPQRSAAERISEDDTAPQDQHKQESESCSVAREQADKSTPSQPVFHFSAGPDNAMQTDDSQPSSFHENDPPVRVEVINRANRSAHKHNTRHLTRSASRTTIQSAGSKRKLPFPDISEIFNLNFDKKDASDGGSGGAAGGGGSKRSRLV